MPHGGVWLAVDAHSLTIALFLLIIGEKGLTRSHHAEED
jgi:hypothetical protein